MAIVDQYKYLGVIFNYNGGFVKSIKDLANRATKCMYSLIRHSRKLDLPLSTQLDLFDSCVLPILLYSCEIWGFTNTDPIELVQRKFCKYIILKKA